MESMKENLIAKEAKQIKEKLWSLNFFLIWQGQLVSALGDVIYEIALGFWILAVTGSTALMGTLMAATMIPRIIISPFAGVYVDRSDRKKLIVLMDLIRGICITFVGIAALFGFIKVWMVFGAGIIMGICAAFFNPSVSSSIPDIVPKSKIVQANSALSMVYTGTNIVANPIGGVLYGTLKAPIMFLLNGISYIFSAITEIFIEIPKIERKNEKVSFKEDMKDGFKFVWKFRGLRYFIILASFLNFFANTAMVLFLPLFQKTASLGSAKYGFAMASLTLGMFIGMALMSVITVPPEKRFSIFIVSAFIFSICLMIFAKTDKYYLMLTLLFIAGFFNAIVNVFFGAVVQLTVPSDMRGKVSALMSTILQGLTPLGMALGGILAEFISINSIIFICFFISTLFFIPAIFIRSFRNFINFNPDTQVIQDIM